MAILEEYKSLRDEACGYLRTMSQLYLYMTIVTATVMGTSINSGNKVATCFLMPLLFPLLFLRNAYLNSNWKINYYIRTHICPLIPELRWSIFVYQMHSCEPHLRSYHMFNIIYIIMGIAPNVYFLCKELSLIYWLMLFINIILAIILVCNEFFRKQPNYPHVELNTKFPKNREM